jgi:hypothetical protein
MFGEGHKEAQKLANWECLLLCAISVFSVSLWWVADYKITTETQRTQRQRMFVLPALNTVVTIFERRYNDFTTGNTLGRRILLDHIIPAVKTGVRTGCPGA